MSVFIDFNVDAQMEDSKIGLIGTPCEVEVKKNVFRYKHII